MKKQIPSIAAIVVLLLTTVAESQETKGEPTSKHLAPHQIVADVNGVLATVKSACVSLDYEAKVPDGRKAEGTGSGTIVSADGYILSAAHVVSYISNEKTIRVSFADGTKATATLLGFNETSDLALLKLNGDRTDYPFVTMAEDISPLGSVVFIYARPADVQPQDPFQLRIGRIKGRQMRENNLDFLNTDISTQPGDSGSGLFNLKGQLIGVACCSNGIGLTHFAAVTMVHREVDQLKAKKRTGNQKENPFLSPQANQLSTTDPAIIQRMIATLKKQINDKYLPVEDRLRKAEKTGEKLQITDALTSVDQMLLLYTEVSYGLDDPAILAQLPKTIPQGAPRRFPVVLDKKRQTCAFPVSETHVILKRSEVEGVRECVLLVGGQGIALERAGEDIQWDLALFTLVGSSKFPIWNWPKETPEIAAGTTLMAPDLLGRISWGIATDVARPIKNRAPLTPWLDASKISDYRAPYPPVIRHTLPLFAADVAAPIFSFQGQLLGLHMGRIGASFGVMIRMADLQASVETMLAHRKADTMKDQMPKDLPAGADHK